jgi:cytochrome d ubiquinol oxidase subunit II
MDLQLIWFLLLGVLMTGYAVLDGFDFGVGILFPLARTDYEQRLFINSIGPLWDGNEVWLVTFGGALFAFFPEAYATIFSGFYAAFILLLFALIFRAVSLEFRGKFRSPAWRSIWGYGFFGSSFLAPLLFGVAVGNIMIGIPLDARGIYTGGFLDLLTPYPVLIGLLAVALFAMHGAIYLFLKTEGDAQVRLGPWIWHTWGLFMVLYLLTTMFTLDQVPTATANFERLPWAKLIVLVKVLAVANIPRAIFHRRFGQAFLSSVVTIVSLIGLFGIAIYPNLVTASNDPALSLTIHNASSSVLTLKIGLLIVAIGMPFILAYTSAIYWIFRGKVRIDEHSY